MLILEITSFAAPLSPFNIPSKVKCVSFKLLSILHASVPNSYITVCSKIGSSGFLIRLNKMLFIRILFHSIYPLHWPYSDPSGNSGQVLGFSPTVTPSNGKFAISNAQRGTLSII